MKYDDFKIFKFSTISKIVDLRRYNFSGIYKNINFKRYKRILVYIIDSIILIIARAVSFACSQFLIGKPSSCKGIFLPNLRYLQDLG